MFDVYREICFNKKKCLQMAKHGFVTMSPNQKTVHGVKIYRLSGKAKVPGSVVSKEGHADNH